VADGARAELDPDRGGGASHSLTARLAVWLGIAGTLVNAWWLQAAIANSDHRTSDGDLDLIGGAVAILIVPLLLAILLAPAIFALVLGIRRFVAARQHSQSPSMAIAAIVTGIVALSLGISALAV
jgi:uncharacterized membrane protein